MTQFIAYLDLDDQEALAHPMTGIASKCKYLPTIADLKQFVDERFKRLNTRATGYKYLKPDRLVEMPPTERRKAQVIAELGYDPSVPNARQRPPLDPGIRDAIIENRWTISSLKTPARPPSRELLALLAEQKESASNG